MTRSLDGTVYNEVVDVWMVPQPDPYTLANFQAAYDKLSAGKSTQTLSKAQAAEFTPSKKLAPTHYAMKIYPKTEEEQRRVEMMEDVQVAYIPFDWVQLTPQEAEKTEQVKTRSAATFPEKSPYTVTYDYTYVTDGGQTGPRTFQLPILYTVWPVSKPLPTDLEHVVDYEVFLPDLSTYNPEDEQAMAILWGEAVSTVRGGATRAGASLSSQQLQQRCSGFVYVADNTLGRNVPLAGLKVRYQDGSLIIDSSTGSTGAYGVYVPVDVAPSQILVPLTFIYQDYPQGRWTITSGSSSVPYSVSTNVLCDQLVGVTLTGDVTLSSSAYQETVIHRAVNYFFNNQSIFGKSVSAFGAMTIRANNSSNGGVAGSFNYLSGEINIYNYGGAHGNVIGTTSHEIGHFSHFNHQSQYTSTPKFLRESFASYVGWYLGRAYYMSQGWNDPGGDPQIVGNSRQSWQKTDTGDLSWYSPLFIDLTDNYNQWTSNPSRPNDTIQGVSASIIWNMITTSTSWTQLKPKIVPYAGSAGWIDNFQYWFDHN